MDSVELSLLLTRNQLIKSFKRLEWVLVEFTFILGTFDAVNFNVS